MNIFYLNEDPVIAAQMSCDKHVVKMILESAQMLSTTHRVLDGNDYADKVGLYKLAHKNHPSTIWVRSSYQHYKWLYDHMIGLMQEYTHRYGKIHLTQQKLESILSVTPVNIPQGELTELPQAMPDDAKLLNVVDAYRNYYRVYKFGFARWTKRQTPEWFNASN